MFRETRAKPVSKVENFGLPQAQIDNVIALDIYRLEGLADESESSSSLDALCDQALIRYIENTYGVDRSHIIKKNGVFTFSNSKENNVHLSVEEIRHELDRAKKAANLIISFSLSVHGYAKPKEDNITLHASPECVRVILKKLQERQDEENRKNEIRNQKFEALFPSALAFARMHEGASLRKQACEPIAEFIESFLGGPLTPDEELVMHRVDHPAEPAWQFIRYRGGQIYDVTEFADRPISKTQEK